MVGQVLLGEFYGASAKYVVISGSVSGTLASFAMSRAILLTFTYQGRRVYEYFAN